MKFVIKSLLFLGFVFYLGCETNSEISINKNEIIFVVEMEFNKNKSKNELKEFSQFYTEAIQTNELETLGWGFYENDGKVTLIERYKDDKAMIQHGENISPGGLLEEHFNKFIDHYYIKKINVYGNASDELKEFVKPFGMPFFFRTPLANFSRN